MWLHVESRRSSIRIKDVDATVFEVLLHYMYKDSLPAFMEESTEEATNMAQHLLVTADRYAIERLKLLCANKLSKTLDVNNVGFTSTLPRETTARNSRIAASSTWYGTVRGLQKS
ncbi:hypothetical protein ZWY2020_019748 [Hordeum vulgare]|nr:hypothetical protein ZWY2020_019748 [Hordeum vulgare]